MRKIKHLIFTNKISITFYSKIEIIEFYKNEKGYSEIEKDIENLSYDDLMKRYDFPLMKINKYAKIDSIDRIYFHEGKKMRFYILNNILKEIRKYETLYEQGIELKINELLKLNTWISDRSSEEQDLIDKTLSQGFRVEKNTIYCICDESFKVENKKFIKKVS